VSKFMHWQYTNICSDGGHAGGHPRGYGAFPRFFSRYVNSANGISRAEAIRKMTSLSADNVGIAERGMLRAGYFADLVLLDPETFRDQATFDAPQKLSGGVKKLWVNGVIVFDEGEATGRYPGRLVQRHNQSRN
jgi:N-acyl-D-amino-acid deacylase